MICITEPEQFERRRAILRRKRLDYLSKKYRETRLEKYMMFAIAEGIDVDYDSRFDNVDVEN